jgi:hypothetical protein
MMQYAMANQKKKKKDGELSTVMRYTTYIMFLKSRRLGWGGAGG